MKFITKIALIFVLASFVLTFDFEHLRPTLRNGVSFEKMLCKLQPGTKIDKHKCLVKYIDRNHLKIDAWGNLTKPIHSMKIRVTFFYKYAIYQQFGGYLNLDICDVMRTNQKRGPILDWYIGLLSKYTSLNHACPYDDVLYLRADNVSIGEFAAPYLMPAGRFDTTVFEDNERILFNISLYFSVSDHRVDVSYSKF